MKLYALNLLLLQNQLKNFGLNPADWSLLKIQNFGFRIQHREDHDLVLYGQIEYRNQSPRWKSLEISL